MMRSPGSSAAPWAARNDRTKATVVGRVLGEAALGHDLARLGHGGDHGPGVTPGDLVPEDHAALADVAGEDRLDVVEGHVEVDQLERGRQPGDPAVVADPDGHLDLDGRRRPAGQGTVAPSGVTPVSTR